jgi:hypothetical protein
MKVISSLFVLAFLCAALPALAEEDWERDWTVVTMTLDGSWGIGTDQYLNAATAAAVRDCKAKSKGSNDCGAKLATTKKGWILGMLCGDYRILVTANDREEVEAAAREREFDLKMHYVPELPTCRQVLVVEPVQAATASQAQAPSETPPAHAARIVPSSRE